MNDQISSFFGKSYKTSDHCVSVYNYYVDRFGFKTSKSRQQNRCILSLQMTPHIQKRGVRELEFRSRALSDRGARDGWKMEINNPLLFYVVTCQIRSMLLLLL